MTSIKELKRYSILCEDGMLVIDAIGKGVTELSVPEIFPRSFCTRNGTVAFFDEKGRLYVTRWTSMVHGILENAGYERKNFEIPFSDGKTPFDPELSAQYHALFK